MSDIEPKTDQSPETEAPEPVGEENAPEPIEEAAEVVAEALDDTGVTAETAETAGPNGEPPKEEAAPEPPPDPSIIGELEPGEVAMLNSIRQSSQQVQMEIGAMEIRKARLLGNISDMESRAQKVMDQVAARLGIPEGAPWSVGVDGKARMMPVQQPQAGQMPTPVAPPVQKPTPVAPPAQKPSSEEG